MHRFETLISTQTAALLKPLKATSVLFCNGPALRYLACASLCFSLCRGESAVYSAFMMQARGRVLVPRRGRSFLGARRGATCSPRRASALVVLGEGSTSLNSDVRRSGAPGPAGWPRR